MSKSGDIIQNVLDVSQMKELQANHMNPVTTKQFRKTFVDFLIGKTVVHLPQVYQELMSVWDFKIVMRSGMNKSIMNPEKSKLLTVCSPQTIMT